MSCFHRQFYLTQLIVRFIFDLGGRGGERHDLFSRLRRSRNHYFKIVVDTESNHSRRGLRLHVMALSCSLFFVSSRLNFVGGFLIVFIVLSLFVYFFCFAVFFFVHFVIICFGRRQNPSKEARNAGHTRNEHLNEPITHIRQGKQCKNNASRNHTHIVFDKLQDKLAVQAAEIKRQHLHNRLRQECFLHKSQIHTPHGHDDREVNQHFPKTNHSRIVEKQFNGHRDAKDRNQKAEHPKEVVHHIVADIGT